MEAKREAYVKPIVTHLAYVQDVQVAMSGTCKVDPGGQGPMASGCLNSPGPGVCSAPGS